ncbi:hypothetical protein IMSHALPRED_006415 [Imshaugia aleurites]|uniref:EF-hand domain-containing protein n=1 Tax=Imshaugia aleurites TaxID=172621 RepID=A0A8H3IRZ8_9LECA|nr:hypothetical protein IMSHALPRED_006415 [Imshaugia aleurites]
MAEEHNIANMDPSAFFTLHKSGAWAPDEVQRTYGLDDESAKRVEGGEEEDLVRVMTETFDVDRDKQVTRKEFGGEWRDGKRLGDFGG